MVSPIVVGGPTGSGKSDYALRLAEEIGGEIICADSRQVYAGMCIGTASPGDAERVRVRHHNYNWIEPSDSYDAARFVSDTDRVVAEVASRGRVPILVGGTGLYLRCWRFGLSDVPQSDPDVRAALRQRVESEGLDVLYAELQNKDPESAQAIYANDEFRIVRALEIFAMTGQKASAMRKSHSQSPRQEASWYLLTMERETLNTRLLERTKHMFEQGLIDEALALRMRFPKSPLLKTIGYEEALACADGTMSQDEAITLTHIRTRQYAKQQTTWFSKEGWWQRDLPAK